MSLIDKYLNESMLRHCAFYEATNGKWYMELADEEYGEQEDATTYGPFSSQESAEKYLNQFSNPGSFYTDTKKKPIPKKSPNGRPVIVPNYGRTGFGILRNYGGYKFR